MDDYLDQLEWVDLLDLARRMRSQLIEGVRLYDTYGLLRPIEGGEPWASNSRALVSEAMGEETNHAATESE